jgi:UDP-N-acetylmuramoylalanine--D-glutamate ligase
MMNLSGKTVAVVGLGESGVAAAELALLQGAEVLAIDSAPEDRLSTAARALAGKGARLFAGRNDEAAVKRADVVVVSSGVPPLRCRLASASGSLVIGELEFGSRFVEAPIVAIGGTNGKSTTTSLAYEMLVAQGKRAFVGANFGLPLSLAAGQPFDVLVLEVSSFQLERAPTFHPRVAALLNVTEDHLDRYPTFLALCAAAKGNMFKDQTSDDVAVVPKGDALVAREAARGDGRLITFGPGGDVGLETGRAAVVDRLRGFEYPIADIRLRGTHNLLNVSAAIACASEAGAQRDAIAAVLSRFAGLAHRTAFVSEIGGVRYYDDSKGTNVGASVSALRGLDERHVVLIAGGRDKLGTYDPLVAEIAKKGRAWC